MIVCQFNNTQSMFLVVACLPYSLFCQWINKLRKVDGSDQDWRRSRKQNPILLIVTKSVVSYCSVLSDVYLQCKPEYKVPGLYIIDSIIRQSRHQYGNDKDLFAARFCKNICTSFQSLYKCPEADKVSINVIMLQK